MFEIRICLHCGAATASADNYWVVQIAELMSLIPPLTSLPATERRWRHAKLFHISLSRKIKLPSPSEDLSKFVWIPILHCTVHKGILFILERQHFHFTALFPSFILGTDTVFALIFGLLY